LRITFLGTGGSLGVPIIGCTCDVCRSGDRRNRRYRPSIVLNYNEQDVLIDAAPELRLQALENDITKLDAVLITHAHADHCMGLDDLRIIIDRHRRRLPLYATQETLRRLKKTFGYLFTSRMWSRDELRLKSIAIDGGFDLFGVLFEPLEVLHENELVTGFRFGDAAYITDASSIPDATFKKLANLDLLIINALRYKPHPKHFGLEEALEAIERVKPRRALLTHMSHEMDYEKLDDELPESVSPAYDGLTVEL
jgi:phosphoribosyl 1,2-cyclic phosphate phosphodiesterase